MLPLHLLYVLYTLSVDIVTVGVTVVVVGVGVVIVVGRTEEIAVCTVGRDKGCADD